MASKFLAKKSLGQNFLINEGACRRIAASLDLQPEDSLIEIGPGHGALTRFLITARTLLLIEKDKQLAYEIAAKFPAMVINGDAMKFPWQKLAGEKWKITGNLPYNVASPLIWDILSQCVSLEKAVFMVQKEVGQRLAAQPGTSHYGALSIWAQSFAKTNLAFTIGPGSFRPAPKVDSAVVTFEPLEISHRPTVPVALSTLLKLCFQQRRKQLGGIFSRAGQHRLLTGIDSLGIDRSSRPEELSPGQFQQLSIYMDAEKSSS